MMVIDFRVNRHMNYIFFLLPDCSDIVFDVSILIRCVQINVQIYLLIIINIEIILVQRKENPRHILLRLYFEYSWCGFTSFLIMIVVYINVTAKWQLARSCVYRTSWGCRNSKCKKKITLKLHLLTFFMIWIRRFFWVAQCWVSLALLTKKKKHWWRAGKN